MENQMRHLAGRNCDDCGYTEVRFHFDQMLSRANKAAGYRIAELESYPQDS
jgi:hypothetical protein